MIIQEICSAAVCGTPVGPCKKYRILLVRRELQAPAPHRQQYGHDGGETITERKYFLQSRFFRRQGGFRISYSFKICNMTKHFFID
jgi:hypothetical protein